VRNNTTFDNKVRNYRSIYDLTIPADTCELCGRRGLYGIHELFSGNDNRKRSFYVENCLVRLCDKCHKKAHGYFHEKIQDIQFAIIGAKLISQSKKQEISIKVIEDYFDKLKLLVNTFDIKQARFAWQRFFDGETETPPILRVV